MLVVSSKCSSDVLLQSKSDTAMIVHFVWGAKEVLISPQARRAYCAKHCQVMLSAHFVGVAAWQTSGKGRSEADRNCQAQMDWEKYVCVLAHAQNIDNIIFFQHAEPVVTVCQSLNFIRCCLCLASLRSLSFPLRLSCLHPGAFVSVVASSCLLKAAFLVFFHPQLHLFHITHSNREAGIACLQYHRVP